MKDRARYTILSLGALVFLIVAPFILMFLSGTRYDFKNRQFVKTGVISARTAPRGAEVYINGKLRGTTPTNIRFLEPGDYDVRIQRPGYLPWNKRLNVKAQYVTWVNQDLASLTLFRSTPQRSEIKQNVSDFEAFDNHVVYTTSEAVYLTEIDDLETEKTFSLGKNVQQLEIFPSKNKKQFLIHNSSDYFAIFEPELEKLTPISQILGSTGVKPRSYKFEFSEDGRLYQLEQGTLYEIDWLNEKKIPVMGNTLAASITADAIYYINTPSEDLVKELGEAGLMYNLIRADRNTLNKLILESNLPAFKEASIHLTAQNEALILGDENFYVLDPTLKSIAGSVANLKLYPDARKVIYATNNEVNVYNLDSQTNSTITRSSKNIKNPQVLFNMGWFFFISDGRLQNMELDNRDHQNNYTFATVNEDAIYLIDQNAKIILLLNQSRLERLYIREPPKFLVPHG